MAELRGLLVDFGGVLTTNVFVAFGGFCTREGLAPDLVRNAFRENDACRAALEGLETGTKTEEDFEREFGAALGLEPEGLIAKLWQDLGPDEEMIEAIARFREAGVKTGLISNSWGTALKYEPAMMERLFDATVISHLEGMRKPDPRIYEVGAERLGLPLEACVFVDDLPGNLKPARAMGMTTVVHREAAQTIAELEELLGVTVSQ